MLAVCNEKITPYFKKSASNIYNVCSNEVSVPCVNVGSSSIDDAQRQIAMNFRYCQEHQLTETKKYNEFVRTAKDLCAEDNVTEIKELLTD